VMAAPAAERNSAPSSPDHAALPDPLKLQIAAQRTSNPEEKRGRRVTDEKPAEWVEWLAVVAPPRRCLARRRQ